MDQALFGALDRVLRRHVPDARLVVLDALRAEVLATTARVNLGVLHAKVMACRACPEMEPKPTIPIGNLVSPNVCFVHPLPLRPGVVRDWWGEELTTAGFVRSDALHTSVVRCDPITARAPSAAERNTCAERYLSGELAALAPRLVISLGVGPTSALLGEAPLGELRGQLHWLGSLPVLATYAPGHVYHHREALPRLRADLAQGAEFVRS